MLIVNIHITHVLFYFFLIIVTTNRIRSKDAHGELHMINNRTNYPYFLSCSKGNQAISFMIISIVIKEIMNSIRHQKLLFVSDKKKNAKRKIIHMHSTMRVVMNLFGNHNYQSFSKKNIIIYIKNGLKHTLVPGATIEMCHIRYIELLLISKFFGIIQNLSNFLFDLHFTIVG